MAKAQVIVSIDGDKWVTDLQAPPRTEPTTLPALTLGVLGERAPMPPPPFQVPAAPPPSLPVLNGAPDRAADATFCALGDRRDRRDHRRQT